jgi:hypothetical protein
MRVARDLRYILRIKRRRGYYRQPLRPERGRPLRPGRLCTAGGVLKGPRGSRGWALDLVRTEIEEGIYLSDWRVNAALDRLIASIF